MMQNLDPSTTIPNSRLDYKVGQAEWTVLLTALRAGSEHPVTVEMTLDQWFDLPPVQYVAKIILSRNQPRRPRENADERTATTTPRGHIEWKDGQNWVVLTAQCAGGDEPVTIELTLAQWFSLSAVQFAFRDGLERWQLGRRMTLPAWLAADGPGYG